jgi:uracil-DNA glycosylase
VTPLVLLGESWGVEEARYGSALVGPSGIELLTQLDESSVLTLTGEDKSYIRKYWDSRNPANLDAVWRLHADEIHRTNVLNFHPHANRLDSVCGPRADGVLGYPALIKSGYLNREYESELERLSDELIAHNPNLIVCLGNTALWAMAGKTGIKNLRGTTLSSTHTATGFKLLPTYHPAAVLRQWELRPTVVMDLMKAKREKEYAEIRRPECQIWIEPSLDDIARFITDFVTGCDLLSVDIETAGQRVTCIGFAPRADLAIVIPFDDNRAANGCYWPSAEHERQCWCLIRGVLEDGAIPKLFQNGVYDIGFLLRSYGILVRGAKEDTMLAHHARQPESLKGLGYLGSIYTDHGSWKHMRKKHETVKRDE